MKSGEWNGMPRPARHNVQHPLSYTRAPVNAQVCISDALQVLNDAL